MDKPNQPSFGVSDYLVFVGMLAISSAIGLYFAYKNRKNHSNKEFLTSNRSLSMFPVAMSLLASFQSSVTILGYPAEMFYRGTQFWMVILSSLMASTIAAELFLPVFYKLGFTSVNEYLEKRFDSKRVRLAVSLSFLLCTVPYMGVVLYGPSLALETVTGLSVASSIMIIGVICTIYTSIGGIKAVIWTDVVQVFLMFGGLLVIMLRGFYLAGGVGAAFAQAARDDRIQLFNLKFDIYSTTTLWNCVIGMGTMWSGNYATSQTEVQRYCNVTTEKRAKLSIYLNFVGVAILISCACLCGIALYGVYFNCDPLQQGVISKTDQLMPYFVMNELAQYPGVAGLFVSCVFSASLSTMSSGFNALATVTYDDFLSKTHWLDDMSERKVQLVSKAVAMAYGLAAIGMAFVVSQIDSILEAAISIAGALVGPMFGLFLLGILVPFANSFGVLCGLFTGELFGLWILVGSMLYPRKAEMLETSIGECPVSPAMNVTSPMLPTQREGLEHLYHIAYLLVPVFGCVISLVVGLIASILSGGLNKSTKVRPEYLSCYAWKIWPQKWLPDQLMLEAGECSKLRSQGSYETSSLQKKSSLGNSLDSAVYMIQSNQNSSDSVVFEQGKKPALLSESKKRRFTKQNAFEFDDQDYDSLHSTKPVVGLKYSNNLSPQPVPPTDAHLAPTATSSTFSSNEDGSSRSVSSSSLSSSPSPIPEDLLNQNNKKSPTN